MFNCERCHVPTGPGIKPIVVAKYRDVEYELVEVQKNGRPKLDRDGNQIPRWNKDTRCYETRQGKEIVKETRVCRECYNDLTAEKEK